MAGWQRETARSCFHFGVASEHRHSCLCAQRTFCRLCFFDFTAQCNCAGRTDCKSVFRLNHEWFRWRVGNAELFFHEIEVDRALRRAMLLKLLLGIASAVEESLTSQGRVALFFTHRLRLEYHDRTWSRRQIFGDSSTSLRSAQDDKGENSAHTGA